jgi:hypothetical protein
VIFVVVSKTLAFHANRFILISTIRIFQLRNGGNIDAEVALKTLKTFNDECAQNSIFFIIC